MAAIPTLELCQKEDYHPEYGNTIMIAEDIVVLLSINPRHYVLVWNWKTGKLLAVGACLTSMSTTGSSVDVRFAA